MKNEVLKSCPFCGHLPDIDDPDTVYPNGIGWIIQEDGYKSYHPHIDTPLNQYCYSVHCVIGAGGCGAEVSGDSRNECIEKWNTRSTPLCAVQEQ